MKICSRCKKEKKDDQFRWRYDKRGKGSKELKYLNNTCRKCDTEISNRHYYKNKEDKNFISNWTKKSIDYYAVHSDEVKAKMKLKRQTPEYKKMMRLYRERRKEIIYRQEVITKRRYHEKHRDNVTDEYVIRQLITQGVATREGLLSHPEIIQAKRIQILIKRKIYQHGN